MELPEALRRLSPVIDERLAALLPKAEGPLELLHAAMRYSALAPGKRVRPVLCLLSADAVAAPAPLSALDGACAVEFVHAFSLIHDDLPAIDNDDLRRGRATCHVEFGEAVAILAGDALFALAFDALSSCGAQPEQIVRAVKSLTLATGSEGLVGGETLDVLGEGQPPNEATVNLIHTRKTGALISAACEIGGILGGGSAGQIAALRKFGEEAGLAFQIADDVLNETATSAELGKASGSDHRRRKSTYPSVFGIDASKRFGSEAAERALAALSPLGVHGKPLGDLARFFVERKY